MPGDMITVPISISDPSAFNVTSAEFAIAYNESRLTALGTIDTGTIAEAAGWAASVFNVTNGRIDVSMAGANPLAGPGVLVQLPFAIDPVNANANVTLTATDGLFNETLPALHQSGVVTITAFATITVSPNTADIVVDEMLQFTVSGTTVPPITWGVTNPTVASIDGAGSLTALSPGTTRVFAVDNVGATDTTDVITVCDLRVIAPTLSIGTITPTLVPILTDRDLTGLGIFGFEMTLTYSSPEVQFFGVTSAGSASEVWGSPTINATVPGEVVIVHAGAVPLTGTLPLIFVSLRAMEGAPTTPLNLTNMVFNEGDPCALTTNGSVTPTGIGELEIARAALLQNIPNPFNPTTTIPYTLPQSGHAVVRIYSPTGMLVRTLVDHFHNIAGYYTTSWDGRSERGETAASGVYFYQLEFQGTRYVSKMVLLK